MVTLLVVWAVFLVKMRSGRGHTGEIRKLRLGFGERNCNELIAVN